MTSFAKHPRKKSTPTRAGKVATTAPRRLPSGPSSGPIQMQRRLGNQGTLAWLAGHHGESATSENDTNKSGAVTGMPSALQSGLEQLSNMDLSSVRVRHNSEKPEQIGGEAFTQGQDIYLAPGQERHLPHEGWHVVQQMQGRVKPTSQAKDWSVNQDRGLEHEADTMGAKARGLAGNGQRRDAESINVNLATVPSVQANTIQLAPKPIPTTKGLDQRIGAQLPDVEKQKEIGAKLDPNAFVMVPVVPPKASGSKKPPKPVMVPKRFEWTGLPKFKDHLKQRAALEKGLLNGLGVFLKATKPRVKAAKAKPRVSMMKKGTGKLAGTDTGVQGIANAAAGVLEKRYGVNMDAAIRTPAQLKTRKAPMSADPKSAGQNLFDAYSKAARKKAVQASSDYDLAFDVGYWATKHDANCTKHTITHHFSPQWYSGKPDWIFLEKVIKKFVKQGSNQADMIDYRLFIWNETAPTGIMLLTTFDPAAFGGNATKAERDKRWQIFGTAIHETLHFREHPSFEAAERGRGTMAEGFVEMFAKDAADPTFKTLRSGGDKALRYAVEGAVTPLDVSVIPAKYNVTGKYNTDWKNAVAIRKMIGDAAARAAFFQGHVEYLGLDPKGADLPGLRAKGAKPTISKPLGIASLAALAKASGLNEAQIKAANPGITDALKPKLVLPGCREHIVVGTKDRKGRIAIERRKHIAAQHGVSQADLVRANPGIPIIKATNAWGPLTIGQKILIPKH